jgi:hypothetical protein
VAVLTYRCTDCGRRREAAADADDLLDLLAFLREHRWCVRNIVLDRVLVLPEPPVSWQLSRGRVAGDLLVHAVVGSSPLALCSGEVLMSREPGSFDEATPGACPRCSAVMHGALH